MTDFEPRAKSGGKHRRKEGRDGPPSPMVRISKALSYILRHGAAKEGIPIRLDGYVKVEDLLRHKKFQGVTFDEIRQVVADNDKQRFTLIEEESERWVIKANQGHSLELEVALDEIIDASEIPVIVHGTFRSKWALIAKTGLKTMGRTHIHFATGLPGESGVISGMRKACDILIYIDTESAIKDGIKFFRSPNNVILCPTPIDPKYFKSVVNQAGQPVPIPP
ncbi:tRNA 2'-phosphotransferase 1 [Dinochytrium kinnereticum]|nr:tRNA 2'-phosphotransferase 1 [Dinochytrium kinnereticum]